MERAIIASVLGLPGYAAIGIALGFTGLGVFIDLERINGLGTVFKGCYFVGCVLAVCWVKRRALFGPIVQPPLLLAFAVPAVVLAAGGAGTNGGTAARLLAIATPLLNGFPTMAVTTAFVLVIGIGRYRVQRLETESELEPVRVASRPATEAEPAGPEPTDPKTAGPETAGPETAGPKSAGPKTAGPKTAGPKSAGPKSAGPEAAGEVDEADREKTALLERERAYLERAERKQQAERNRLERERADRGRSADQRPGKQPPGRPDPDDDEPTSLLPLTSGSPAESEPKQRPPRKPDRAPQRPS
jgi:hypothetical protein